MEFGWSKVYLGSWRNLVFGHDPHATMRITLHGEDDESIMWSFEQGEEFPHVASFLIKKGEIPIARGTNSSPKLINWDIEIHRSHELLRSFREIVLNRLHDTPWHGPIEQPFNSHFDSWLGGDWVPLPEHLKSDDQCSELFPANLADNYVTKVILDETITQNVCENLLVALTNQDTSLSYAIMDSLFQNMEWHRPDREMEKSLKSQLYVGNNRNLPIGMLSRRSLSISPETKPWLTLIDNQSDGFRLTPREELNSMLNNLEIGYHVRTRLRKESILIQQECKENLITQEEEPYVSHEELVFQDEMKVLHPIHALGAGFGKVLPILVAMATSDVELLILEEPESNIHPRLQASLGDIVIKSSSIGRNVTSDLSYEDDMPYAIDETTETRNILIETHSEHLILRILRRIRETTRGKLPEDVQGVRVDDVAVLYVELGEEGKGASVRQLRFNEQGRFINEWPNGFFEDRLEELI